MTSIEDDWVEVSHPERGTFLYPPMPSTEKPMDPGLPRSNPTKSAWEIPPDPLQSYRSTERLPTDILDIVIIGSGFSAASVAWHLLRGDGLSRQMPMKTLMLEARDVCSGATGRNGGHLSCDFYSYYSTVEKQYDAEEAARHSQFERLNFEAVRDVIWGEKIDCEFNWNEGGWDVFLTDEEFSNAKREVERMKAAGGFIASLKIFEGQVAAKAAGVKFCKGAIQTRERASLRPYALVTSLLRILIRNYRLQLHTNTPVTSIISPAGGTGHYTIHTSRGIVKARHVINATNAWISHLYPEFEKKIIPTRGQVVQVDGKHLKLNPMGFNDGGEYLVQRPDNSIIFGGGRRFASTKYHEIGNTDDTSIDAAVSQFLHTFLPSQLPLNRISGTAPPIDWIREWTGIMGFSHDSHPFVGHSDDEPRKWVIGGFHGHGMVRIWLCAKALVQQLQSQDSGHDEPWPDWMPHGYIHHPNRINAIGEIKQYFS